MNDGALQTAGTTRLTNGGGLQNITGISSSGTITFSGLSAGGIVKTDTSGNLLLATAGTDYENPITFSDGLTRTTNTVNIGGSITANRDIALGSNTFSFSGSGLVAIGNTTASGKLSIDDGTTNPSLFINKTNGTGNILTLQKSGTGVFTISNSGAVQISSTSTSAFTVSNNGGSSNFFSEDTSGAIIQIGSSTGDATGVLFVLDSKTGADPITGVVNGAQYYNSTNNRFRCYENGAWRDCISLREDLVAHWNLSSTKTNIGTAFVDIFTQTNSDGKSVQIDTNDKTQLRLVVNWNKVGTGTQTVQILEVGTANVLATMNVVSGRNDTGIINIPAFATNSVKYYKIQAKSTTAGDDPVFESASITLK